jgi:hypothetical protein
MGYRVESLGPGELPETLRVVSLNCSIKVARGAFAAAVKAYPNQRMRLNGERTLSSSTSRRK